MSQDYTELAYQIIGSYDACQLKSVNAFNKFQFEKILENLFNEYQKIGLSKSDFNEILMSSLESVGVEYGK